MADIIVRSEEELRRVVIDHIEKGDIVRIYLDEAKEGDEDGEGDK